MRNLVAGAGGYLEKSRVLVFKGRLVWERAFSIQTRDRRRRASVQHVEPSFSKAVRDQQRQHHPGPCRNANYPAPPRPAAHRALGVGPGNLVLTGLPGDAVLA